MDYSINKGITLVEQEGFYMLDLISCEASANLAYTVALIGDRIHPFTVKRIRHKLQRRVFSSIYRNGFYWKSTHNNRSSVCACNLLITALYTVRDSREL